MRTTSMATLAGAVAVFFALVQPAQADTLITFEENIGATAMVNVPGSSVPAAARLGNQYLSQGALFKSSGGFVTVLGDRFPLNSGFITLTAFGLTGNLLGSVSAADVGPIGTGATLTLTLPGIHRVVLANDTGTVGYDNLQFAALVAVPEPTALLLLLAGLGVLGLRAKRH